MKQITYYFLSLITAFAVNKASAQETRTSEGMPKIGDFYQSAINLDGKRRLIIPDGRWEVNNVFDDKEGNWHASWKVITLINRDYSSPFRMTVVRYFTASVPRWPAEDCEKKSNVYAFGHDLNGSKGSRSVCSNFFYWSNPQEQIRLTLPRYYNFYWAKALNKLPSEFIQGLSKDQLMLEIGASQGGGLYIRQDVLIDAQSIGVNAEDFKLGFTSTREGTNSKAILNWRTSYVQAVSKAFLDSQEISQAAYAFKSPTAAPNKNVTATNTEINKVEKIDSKSNLQNAQKNNENSVTEIELNEIAQERKKIELEKKILEERKKLDEEKRKLEEEKKLAEIDAIKRQKELLALQEERSQLEQKQLQKLQEDRLRQEKIAATQADAKAKLDEERARKEQERTLAEEAKKREEAQRKEAAERRRAAELAKAEEEKRRKEKEAIALYEKRKQQEEERRLALEAKKAEEEEKKKVEAYKKSPPIIEVTQSEPDEFGAVVLDITVSKPTKSLAVNGEPEGSSKDGKYRIKRILKKTGKTVFNMVAFDEFGNKASSSYSGTLSNNKDITSADDKSQMQATDLFNGQEKGETQVTSKGSNKTIFDSSHYYFDCNDGGFVELWLGAAGDSIRHGNKSTSKLIEELKTKSGFAFKNKFDCTMVGKDPSSEDPNGEALVIFSEKKKFSDLKERVANRGANSFEFSAVGGLVALQTFNKKQKDICYVVKYTTEKNKELANGHIQIESSEIPVPKAVSDCSNKTPIDKNTPKSNQVIIKSSQAQVETSSGQQDKILKKGATQKDWQPASQIAKGSSLISGLISSIRPEKIDFSYQEARNTILLYVTPYYPERPSETLKYAQEELRQQKFSEVFNRIDDVMRSNPDEPDLQATYCIMIDSAMFELKKMNPSDFDKNTFDLCIRILKELAGNGNALALYWRAFYFPDRETGQNSHSKDLEDAGNKRHALAALQAGRGFALGAPGFARDQAKAKPLLEFARSKFLDAKSVIDNIDEIYVAAADIERRENARIEKEEKIKRDFETARSEFKSFEIFIGCEDKYNAGRAQSVAKLAAQLAADDYIAQMTDLMQRSRPSINCNLQKGVFEKNKFSNENTDVVIGRDGSRLFVVQISRSYSVVLLGRK
jgi:hypothetical protein